MIFPLLTFPGKIIIKHNEAIEHGDIAAGSIQRQR
jgi:hypothetical protein